MNSDSSINEMPLLDQGELLEVKNEPQDDVTVKTEPEELDAIYIKEERDPDDEHPLEKNDGLERDSKAEVFTEDMEMKEYKKFKHEDIIKVSTPPTVSESRDSGSGHGSTIKETETDLCKSDLNPYSIVCTLIEESEEHKPSDEAATHTDQFVCEICFKQYPSQFSLNNHMKLHKNELQYSCEVCTKCFSLKGNLKAHMRTHTGDRPFTCHLCGKCFSQRHRLVEHVRRHTGDLPFSCQVCGKSFTRKDYLCVHMRKHTGDLPFSCEVCGKSFARKDHLSVHERTHTGNLPFSCKLCGKSFGRNDHLKVHMRIHTNDFPFSCELCKKSFVWKATLNAHMNTHKK